ncbi:aldehyde dehydrogenase [Oceanibacterium hippocampi]|uniref:Aldehyde dehydrogenase PuuC n=1 Tax=Oceanibacterium hippocampi TaxID=745714 RepID=A0A1Y5TLE9_9PROT|nr:aldehyde dehydrogenase [Oceanibacterium hippocampi]SLN66630.1 Aldehyde dehydrogenase PuuC [Oceanibacterium hippocampi]
MHEIVASADIEGISKTVRSPANAFIDGRLQAARSGRRFETLNPATAEVLGSVAACDAADVDLAVAAARRAFNERKWSGAAPEDRKDVLLRLANLIREHAEDLAMLESLDSGKTITDCRAEIGEEVPRFFQWYGELIDKTFGKIAPTDESALALIMQEPIGVVGLVLPWNFPLLMAAWKVAPALAAGCSIVLKPAEQTPLTALRLAELSSEAGLPDGVLNVVPGFGETAGQAIGRHMDIDAISFTGSTETGALFLKYASESNLKPVALEMGGKSPFIVLEDADISEELIENAVSAAMWNGGQNCSANMRQFVHQSRKDEFLGAVIERVGRIRAGNPLDPSTDMGAMVSAEHRQRVLGYIAKGVSEGARLVTGGEAPLPGMAGYFVRPTVFDRVTPAMTVAREEIFGPVLGVMSFSEPEEALAMAADSVYGLHATVFTRDIDRALHFARRLPCGTVSINRFTEGDIKTPFGGYKRSGSLARDNGTEALEQYLQKKTIWISRSKAGVGATSA